VPFFQGNSERLYYQQYGGWYQDTQAELKMVETISDLTDMILKQGQEEGTLVYVRNDDEWKTNSDTKNLSHYWILLDSNKSIIKDGWYNLTVEQTLESFSVTTAEGTTVTVNIQAYFQVSSTNEGNNPHTGGTLGYDYGYDYLRHFGYHIVNSDDKNITPPLSTPKGTVTNTHGLFTHTLNNSPECMWNTPQYRLLENVGFKLKGYIDNKGCWAVYRNEGYNKRLETGYISEPTGTPKYRDDILMIDPSYAINRKYLTKEKCAYIPMSDDTVNTRLVTLPQNKEFYRIINCKNIIFRYNSNDKSEEYFFINNANQELKIRKMKAAAILPNMCIASPFVDLTLLAS
jgi:hypothetical protein